MLRNLLIIFLRELENRLEKQKATQRYIEEFKTKRDEVGAQFNLSPNIHVQILQTDLHTFPIRISGGNLIKDQGILSLVIILLILITSSIHNVWILLGENCCWSLLALLCNTLFSWICCLAYLG